MTADARLREDICRLARSMFDRGLTPGASGNISARTEDGGLLVTPTGSSFGDLDPARLSRFDALGRHVAGDAPTKEMSLHQAFYDTRQGAGAVVHLHSCLAVAWSMMPDVDPENLLPPLTAYSIMRLGKVQLLPFFLPGDPAMGQAVRGLAGRRSAVVLANHTIRLVWANRSRFRATRSFGRSRCDGRVHLGPTKPTGGFTLRSTSNDRSGDPIALPQLRRGDGDRRRGIKLENQLATRRPFSFDSIHLPRPRNWQNQIRPRLPHPRLPLRILSPLPHPLTRAHLISQR